jgi:hypothetical protein
LVSGFQWWFINLGSAGLIRFGLGSGFGFDEAGPLRLHRSESGSCNVLCLFLLGSQVNTLVGLEGIECFSAWRVAAIVLAIAFTVTGLLLTLSEIVILLLCHFVFLLFSAFLVLSVGVGDD